MLHGATVYISGESLYALVTFLQVGMAFQQLLLQEAFYLRLESRKLMLVSWFNIWGESAEKVKRQRPSQKLVRPELLAPSPRKLC